MADNLVQGKCPNCGAPLKIDPNQKAWLCEYCNTPFIVRDNITNYNYNIKKGNVKADKVYINKRSSFDAFRDMVKDSYEHAEFERKRLDEHPTEKKLTYLATLIFVIILCIIIVYLWNMQMSMSPH